MTYTTIICKKLNNKLPFNLHHIINRSENSDGFYFYKKYIFNIYVKILKIYNIYNIHYNQIFSK